MSRYIDVDEPLTYFTELMKEKDIGFGDIGRMITVKIEHVINVLNTTTTIKTKQIKYFDEEEKVWKVGSVIVNE